MRHTYYIDKVIKDFISLKESVYFTLSTEINRESLVGFGDRI